MTLLEEVKNFTLNRSINNYKEFVDYFYDLNLDEKNNIIYYMLLYKKSLCNIKNGNLDKIYNMYKILLHKLKYDKLNSKEMYIYEHIMAYLIIRGDFKNDELFEYYVSTYLNNISRYNFSNRVFIVMQDIINKLNKEYNKDYCLSFQEQKPIACTNWAYEEYIDKICLSKEVYSEIYTNKTIDDVDLVKNFAYDAFVILHEYRHLLQFDHMRNSDDELAQKCKFDVFSIWTQEKLYKNNHHSFYIEKDANEFAYQNFYRFIKCYFSNVYVNEEDIKRYNYNNFYIYRKDRKMFIYLYKYLKKIFGYLYESKIEIKTIKLFKSKLGKKN